MNNIISSIFKANDNNNNLAGYRRMWVKSPVPHIYALITPEVHMVANVKSRRLHVLKGLSLLPEIMEIGDRHRITVVNDIFT